VHYHVPFAQLKTARVLLCSFQHQAGSVSHGVTQRVLQGNTAPDVLFGPQTRRFDALACPSGQKRARTHFADY